MTIQQLIDQLSRCDVNAKVKLKTYSPGTQEGSESTHDVEEVEDCGDVVFIS